MKPTASDFAETMARNQTSSESNPPLKPLFAHSPMPAEDESPATKQDLEILRRELHSDMEHLRDELIEKMRDMQTEVLRAFHDWARPVEIRLRSIPNIEERLGHLEERVSALERRRAG